ncbi:MAG: RrF2 family transcriptional regulator [Christensenellales bacterium]|jgi:Rrf2 family iron-sulfur cluster assembly transcriptional regulator
MLVSTKGRYALRVMIDLAERNTGDYIPLKEIAKRQEISEKYLESIVSALAKADYVTGLRGKGGGYKLTKSPGQYTVGAILKVTEGSLAPVSCLDDISNNCERAGECKTLPLWMGLSKLINDYLEGITLEDLAKEPVEQINYTI